MEWTEFRIALRHLSTDDQSRVHRGFLLGQEVHKGQRRKSGEPFFSHPIAVAQMLAFMGADGDTIIAALLHDSVEDTPLTLEEIHRQFDGHVVTLIDGVTKIQSTDIPEEKTVDEQIETLRKIFTTMQRDVRIMVIKLTDRLHNMQTVQFLAPDRQRLLAQETQDVYVKIADRLCMQDVRDELALTCIGILEPDALPGIVALQQQSERHGTSVINRMERRLRAAFPRFKSPLLFEAKSIETLRGLLRHEAAREQNPPVTVTLICDDVAECYATLGLLHQLWQREILSFEDFINSPFINGYKGLHTTIILEDGTRVRCKMRTREMHEYARRGITTQCFTRKARGALTYLPWTQRISPLAEDTMDRSDEFWQSLQSDILGESIVIHGHGDQTILVPGGSTALDGAFYLFGERALNVERVELNGIPVPFSEPLPNAAALSVTFAGNPRVELQWLHEVQTGLAAALIRKGLSDEQYGKKVETGNLILQEHFRRHGRGFLTEFEPASLANVLRSHGFASVDDIAVRLAEGRMDAQEVEQIFFEKRRRNNAPSMRQRRHILTCEVPSLHRRMFSEIIQYYRTPHVSVRQHNGTLRFCAVLSLTDAERATLALTLQHSMSSAFRLERVSERLVRIAVNITMFLLWGLDPVVAALLLNDTDVSPINLTMVRFIALTVMSGLVLWIAQLRQPLAQARLSLRNPNLILGAMCMLGVSLTSYSALIDTPPTHYTIPMTMVGMFLTAISNRTPIISLASSAFFVILGIGVLISATPMWSTLSMLFTLGAVVSFGAASVLGDRYKRQEKVNLRSMQYFFLLSLLSMIMVLPLFPFAEFGNTSWILLGEMTLFSLTFAGLPYYLFYYILSHRDVSPISRATFLIMPITAIGQWFFLPVAPAAIAAMALVTLGAVIPLLPKRHQST
jgi:RelA/SpoT family (p)ppGpp synthetase